MSTTWEEYKVKKRNPFTYIPADKVEEMVGKQVHTDWACSGAHWILKKLLPHGFVILRTPKTGKEVTTHQATLQYTRKHEPIENEC